MFSSLFNYFRFSEQNDDIQLLKLLIIFSVTPRPHILHIAYILYILLLYFVLNGIPCCRHILKLFNSICSMLYYVWLPKPLLECYVWRKNIHLNIYTFSQYYTNSILYVFENNFRNSSFISHHIHIDVVKVLKQHVFFGLST